MTSTASVYPIRAVARLTGISIDTLRAWERRYQAVVPERGERGRVYRIAHVTRLKRLDALVRRGHAIGSIAQLSDRHLTQLIVRADAHAAPPSPAVALASVDLTRLIDAVDAFDLPAIDADLTRLATLLTAPQFIGRVALPLLRELGDRWRSGSLRPSHEHLISSIVRTVLGGLLRTAPRRPGGRTIVFATPAGEHHELGVLAAAVLAAEAEFNVLYLGPDLPAEDIAAVARTSGAGAIVIGVTIGTPAKQVARLARLAPKTVLLVGGPRAATAVHGVPRAHHAADLDAFDAQLRRLIR